MSDHTLADDILRGAKAIADYIGLSERDAFDKLIKGYIPATKEGSIWVGSKSRLQRFYCEDRYEPPSRDGEAAAPIKRGRKHSTTKQKTKSAA